MKKIVVVLMKNKYVIVAGILFAAVLLHTSCVQNNNKVYAQRAVFLFDNILNLYKTSGPEGQVLFYETYPKGNNTVRYLAAGDTLEYQRVAYLWSTSCLLAAINTLSETTGDDLYTRNFENIILPAVESYIDTTRTPHGFQSYPAIFGYADRYYDDNLWVGQQMLKSYELTGNKKYLEYAKTIWNFVQTGADDMLGGGIYWCEQKKFTKNTCSNAPAVTMALLLYQATADDSYLEAGKQLYRWIKNHLQDPADGLYYDRLNLDGTVDKAKYAYNSGQMLLAASLLYRINGENAYLDDARKLAEACGDYFFETVATEGKPVRILKNGNVWFAAVMLRGFIEYYRIDGNPVHINNYKTTLDRLWTDAKDENHLFNDNRLADPPRYGDNIKWLLAQAAFVEMYARLSTLK